ncbi:MAG: hypothetical protein NTY98_25875 [Verrucomicrobia bacterium]|nr:hypothetical protein [Verrucomicrobiota bacterium]
MTASDVMELYDSLPEQEKRIVAEHIRNAAAQMSEPKPQVEFKELVNQVFEKHSGLMERLAQ